MANVVGGESENSSGNITKSFPKDALVIATILKEMGVRDYEPRVLSQLLELTYRYVSDILDDARIYSGHAHKKRLNVEDVRLAIKNYLDQSYTSAPPRDFLVSIARQRNENPLPIVQVKNGLRLPPERYCMTNANYQLKPSSRKHINRGTVHSQSAAASTNRPNGSASNINTANKNGVSTTSSVDTRIGTPSLTQTKNQQVSQASSFNRKIEIAAIHSKTSNNEKEVAPASEKERQAVGAITAASDTAVSSESSTNVQRAVDEDTTLEMSSTAKDTSMDSSPIAAVSATLDTVGQVKRKRDNNE